MKTLIVSPVGEHGCGKSTLALWLAYELKMRGIVAELVPEVIKYEIYNPAYRQKALSGQDDTRLLVLQHQLTKPLVDHVEVIINDGALEPFYHYAEMRVEPGQLKEFKILLDHFRQDTQHCDHIFVSPVRETPYEQTGREQTEEQSQQMRAELLNMLDGEFSIDPMILATNDERQQLLDDIVFKVLKNRVSQNSKMSL